ncbi:MAG: insulinase family protein [Bdellovibrionales bacterium]|nr:insulinase family protein [Bdellovibrionales bacterium]
MLRSIFLSLFLFLPFNTYASPDVSQAALSRVKEQVIKETLDNGLRVLIYPRPVAPVFAGVVTVHLGGVDEHIGNTGGSHLLEHMAFKGTESIGTTDYSQEKKLLTQLENLLGDGRQVSELSEKEKETLKSLYEQLNKVWKTDELSRIFRAIGGVGLNATTAKEMTNYFVNLPRTAFEHWCWLESERLLNPVMRQFYKERDVVLEERRMRYVDDPGGRLYEAMLGTAYLSHPYRNPVIGYEFDVSTLTVSDVEDLHHQYYVPNNMVISLVGDIDPVKAMPLIRKYFGRLPVRPYPVHPRQKEEEQDGERRVIIRDDSEPQVGIAYKKPNYPDPDDPVLGVLSEILTGGRTSALYKELVEKKKLTTSFSAFEAPDNGYPNLLFFYGDVRSPHTPEEVLKGFDQAIHSFIQRGPTDEEMQIAKRAMSMSYLTELQSNMSMARGLASSELAHGSWKASFDWYEQMLKVTREDVQRAAEQYLVPERRTVGFVKPERKRKEA